MKKITTILMIAALLFAFVGVANAEVNSVTPSTNDINTTNGWAHVNEVNVDIGEVTLEFVSTRNFYSCFEYRTDGDISQVIGVNYNSAVIDGLYPYFCENNSSSVHTFYANEYVEIRMVFGAEGDERFDWTRFDVIPDVESPITTLVAANPNPASVNSSVSLVANVDDTNSGGSNIVSADYSLDGGSTWSPMTALDNAFDDADEDVAAYFAAPLEPGIYTLCVRGTDKPGNVGNSECIMFVVYDPSGGFVTGGGWIDSPEGAYHPEEYPTGETFFLDMFDTDPYLSDTAIDGAWYPDRYRPATFESAFFDGDNRLHVFIDGDDAYPHGTNTTFYNFQGRKYNLGNDVNTYITADLYIGTDWENNQRHASLWATTYDADGNISGYPIAGFTEGNGFRIFTQDTDQDPGNGYQAGWYDVGYPINFEYGKWYTIRAELTETAYRYYLNGELVWSDSATYDSVLWANMMLQAYNYGEDYDVYWDNVGAGPILPTGKATFGFVSKYKKGASIPEGTTEFQFKAGGLNFHSTNYDWLVVNQGGTNAQFKGYGTINGAGNYGFMLWAGDGSPDTFRIKIWDATTEEVVYDNGPDQPIGGGNIVVHTKK
jgi:hypothetical protein